MKKFMLVLLVSLFPVALTYARTNHQDLTQRVGSIVAKVQTNSNRVLQKYIDLCDGNEKLGNILYDIRKGKPPRANALGEYVITRDYEAYFTLTGFSPFQKMTAINRYYPDGIWEVVNGEVKHLKGPLVGVLQGHHPDTGYCYKRDFLTGRYDYNCYSVRGYIDYAYSVYNQKGERVFQRLGERYDLPPFLQVPIGDYNFRVHYRQALKGLLPFDKEADAQRVVNRQKAAAERAKRKAARKEKIGEALVETVEKWEELFH
ncbi:MAG: hypothetical protein IKP96_03955 [Elusimicrobiaceae bacterium]|nr:hypothetical protein [Elusimicrobiaceae bacterium]